MADKKSLTISLVRPTLRAQINTNIRLIICSLWRNPLNKGMMTALVTLIVTTTQEKLKKEEKINSPDRSYGFLFSQLPGVFCISRKNSNIWNDFYFLLYYLNDGILPYKMSFPRLCFSVSYFIVGKNILLFRKSISW